jgi:Lon protease-like protein
MIPGEAELGFSDLPEALPVFPLAGVLLLPRAHLPLNIFEPRYLNMVRDALERRDRLIGMIQPTDPRSGLHEPPLYRIGCAGRIVESSDTSDGRILISLVGICRFALTAEIEGMKGYRRVRPDWQSYRQDLACDEDRVDRPRLVAALKRYFHLNAIEADWDALDRTPSERLVSSIAMICPFDPSEKQALLEAPDLNARAETMIALIEMAIIDPQGEGAPAPSRH